MAFRKKTYQRKRTFKRKTATKVRKIIKRARQAPLRKMIKAEIHRQIENKTIQTVSAIYIPTTTSDTAGVDINNAIIRLTPSSTLSYQIAQGDGQGQRSGNQVTTRKMVIRGVLTAEPYSTTGDRPNTGPVPIVVRMHLMYDKRTPNGIDPSNNNEVNPTPQSPNNDFFQFGNTTTGFQGTNLDQMQTINTDRYAVLASKTFKIGFQRYDGTTQSTNPTAAQQFYTNNDFKMQVPIRWNVTKYMPKKIKFNDASTSPNCRGLFLMSYGVPATGNAVTALAPVPQALFRFTTDYQYEDA